MKNILIFLIVIVAAAAAYLLFFNTERTDSPAETDITDTSAADEQNAIARGEVTAIPISHATMMLEWGETTVYVDPVGGAGAFAGLSAPDLILVTDIHGDHLDQETLQAVIEDDTALVAPQAVADELPDTLAQRTRVLENGATTEVAALSIEAIPMYNLPESEDSFHTKGRGNGYVLERDETRVYIAGDTEDIPEMRALSGIDIAFVPMNLPYTMDVETAADAVLDFAPSVVYPYHYRGEDGLSDVDAFKRLVEADDSDIEVILANWYPNRSAAAEDGDASGDEASETDTPASAGTDSRNEDENEEVVIDMTGRNYEFSQEEVTVNKGDTVTVNLTSEQGFHDWTVDAFGGVATDPVETGETVSVTFVADEAGTFEYYCSVSNHRELGMVGTITVE